MLTATDYARASRELASRDRGMAAMYAALGPYQPGRRHPTHFVALARSIVFQQLAGAAARTIWDRFAALHDGHPTPETTLALSDAQLRGAGLSGSKAAAIRDLATREAAGELRLRGIGRLDDQRVVERLTTVHGIGEWTAQMFLLFQLRRPDVWPTGDLGVRKGYARIYGLDSPPVPAALAEAGERFTPWRSVAAWYCWRATDNPPLRAGLTPDPT